MTKDSTFFVNLRKEDTKMLKTKLGWIVDELERRIIKANDTSQSNIIKAISRPIKTEMSKSEIIENVVRWRENSTLKVHMCLNFLKKNGWVVSRAKFLDYGKNELGIKKPELFLLSLTKKPYIREWTNIEDQKRKASDYGDVLKIVSGNVELNPKYNNDIIKVWSGD